ncbi:hypothetical protein HII17_08840 [Thalassotalea sp. M1531]|uniref:Peptidase M61 catalytic domain-containing protein n=1 Tax=Thalassotalea algicola TaxID=2716224 RepID=A0A7Y0LDJ6_9GAMM|nr:hypothetical protein [Thalassotalea algicola]NMP31666.1 hypothetical protein [Thalassotalea algicola]
MKAFVAWIAITLTTIFSTITCAKNILITDISKDSANNWKVTYRSKAPISSLQLAITKDDSRLERWRIVDKGFEFRQSNGLDTLFRRDGGQFTQVSFSLTPTYIHLPKYYAPFSPFSDGSMLFHSARFFACPELCSGIENLWYIRLTAPKNETIIIDGMVTNGSASWYDYNDGKKVYVGGLAPSEFANLLAVVDPSLPDKVTTTLNQFLPKAFALLSNKIRPLEQKPTLFASLGENSDDKYGRQGGVLPNQIFMHWYGKLGKLDYFDLLWFYAHEAVHIFQGIEQMNIDNANAWIHEGHADYLASVLLLNFYPEAKSYVEERINRAAKSCVTSLETLALEEFSNNGKYKELYDCGLYYYSSLAAASNDKENMPYSFWRLVVNESLATSKIDMSSVERVSKQLVDEDKVRQIVVNLKGK